MVTAATASSKSEGKTLARITLRLFINRILSSVVLGAFLGVSEDLVSLGNLVKLSVRKVGFFFCLALATTADLVWMHRQRFLLVGFLDCSIVGILRNIQNLIVILHLAFLEQLLCSFKLLFCFVTVFLKVQSSLAVSHSLLPILEPLQSLRTRQEGLHPLLPIMNLLRDIHDFRASFNRLSVLLQLDENLASSEVHLASEQHMIRIDLRSLFIALQCFIVLLRVHFFLRCFCNIFHLLNLSVCLLAHFMLRVKAQSFSKMSLSHVKLVHLIVSLASHGQCCHMFAVYLECFTSVCKSVFSVSQLQMAFGSHQQELDTIGSNIYGFVQMITRRLIVLLLQQRLCCIIRLFSEVKVA
mmetsp:Transcript_16022/g.53699  ORF Transcript_16022/g.53699 Transcript_16022/m.53699 type:complete len:355 (+) Transcript_16022:98-1162(+)